MGIEPIAAIESVGAYYIPPVAPPYAASDRHYYTSIPLKNGQGTEEISRTITESQDGSIIAVTETVGYTYDRVATLYTLVDPQNRGQTVDKLV